MVLYHFCPAHLKDRILAEGLTKGKFPLRGDGHYTLVDGFQWLTANKDPAKQSWATQRHIPYSRTAYRLTVEIPKSRLKKLCRAIDLLNDLAPEQREIITAWPGSEHWYIFQGRIPAKWIVGYRAMEGRQTTHQRPPLHSMRHVYRVCTNPKCNDWNDEPERVVVPYVVIEEKEKSFLVERKGWHGKKHQHLVPNHSCFDSFEAAEATMKGAANE